MFADNVAQAATYTISKDSTANFPGCDETGTKAQVFFFNCNSDREEVAAIDFSLLTNPRKFRGTSEPLVFSKRQGTRLHRAKNSATCDRRISKSVARLSEKWRFGYRIRYRNLYSKNLPALPAREDLLLSESLNYGVGDAVVVVVSVVVVDVSGVVGVIGVDSAGVVVVVVVVLSVVAGLVSGAGEAAGVTSVLCSQAARSAALARMQMYFFISVKD